MLPLTHYYSHSKAQIAMKALVIQKQGIPVHPSVQFVHDWPEPEPPTANQITIQVQATALNHLDLWVGRGVPGTSLQYPRISGSDVCGIIQAVGPNLDEEKYLGKRVILNAAVPVDPSPSFQTPPPRPRLSVIGEQTSGVHCEFLNLPASQVAIIEDHVPATAAAAFGLSFLTAWSCLVTRAELKPGRTILITGIGGGVALSALMIAKLLGCRVIATSRSTSKLDKAKELGVDETILHTKGQDWSREVRALTSKRGVDVAIDSIGKTTHLMCLKSLANGGTYVTPGCTTGPDAVTDLARVFWNQLRIIGSTMGDMSEFRQVVALLNSAKLDPVIDSTYPASDGKVAFKRLESGDHFGKVAIDWTE